MDKKIFIWLAAALFAYGCLFGATHLYLKSSPRRIAIVMDTSFEMEKHEKAMYDRIVKTFGTRYSEFSLFTDKALVFTWTANPHVSRTLKFYGPENFDNLLSDSFSTELEKADRIIVFSNSDKAKVLKGKYSNVSIVKP